MKLRQRSVKKARLEIIPMIDVMFFLLVFFMLSSLSLSRIHSVPVDLPKTQTAMKPTNGPIVLTLNTTGQMWINQKQVEQSTLKWALSEAFNEHAEESLIIQADKGLPYGQVVSVMDLAREVGIRKFSLATQKNK